MLLAYRMVLSSPHRISRHRPFDTPSALRQAQGPEAQDNSSGDGSASATPPQGGSDWTIRPARAFPATDLVVAEQREAAPVETDLVSIEVETPGQVADQQLLRVPPFRRFHPPFQKVGPSRRIPIYSSKPPAVRRYPTAHKEKRIRLLLVQDFLEPAVE